jgi:hypothetical protein
MVLIDKIPPERRPLADAMLASDLERQMRLKADLASDSERSSWLDERHVFQNYKHQ